MGTERTALADLLVTTRKDYGTTFEVTHKYQRYPFCNRLQTKNYKVDGGTSIVRNIMLDDSGQARFILPYEVEDTTVADVHTQMEVPWTQFRSKYAFDDYEIKAQKGSCHGYIDLFKTRQVDCYVGIANMIEEAGWQGRLSAADTTNPLGIPEALCMLDAGETTAGFSGQTVRYRGGTTGTTFQSIDASSEDRWKNYAFVYSAIDNEFAYQLTLAQLKTNFRAPSFVPLPEQANQMGTRAMYAPAITLARLHRIANAQDDNNVPNDLAGRLGVSADGTLMFNGVPMEYAPYLDSATYSPIYAVNWDVLQMVVRDGRWMFEYDPIDGGITMPSVTVIFVEGQYQQLCLNRRTVGFVGHTVTS